MWFVCLVCPLSGSPRAPGVFEPYPQAPQQSPPGALNGKEGKPGYEGYVFLTPPRVAMYATT